VCVHVRVCVYVRRAVRAVCVAYLWRRGILYFGFWDDFDFFDAQRTWAPQLAASHAYAIIMCVCARHVCIHDTYVFHFNMPN
jgi:hypothetical protein